MIKINNQNLSENFIRKIAEFSAGYFTPDKLDSFFQLIEKEKEKFYFDSTSEANLLRIILGMYNKISFIEECINYPHYVEIIVSVSAVSNYLSDVLVRDPEYFYWIVNPSNLKSKLSLTGFDENLQKSIQAYISFNAKLNALKGIKRKEILRIGLKDILKIEDLKSITEELSILAKILAKNLFETAYQEILKKYKINKTTRNYCLISLGKLGGNELNYSSDIDLMVFYDKDSRIGQRKEYYEILTETILLFVESASNITDNGFLYRVDFRLRPDGRNSPLCNTLMSCINYYESRGEDWERQMLLKVDLICGSKDLFDRFKSFINPFIFPSSFSTSPIEQIKKLRSVVEQNLNEDRNIKLTSGGIRNIEFSVQALQLLNGGKYPELRTGNSLIAIEELTKKGLLTEKESLVFSQSYIFYRKIEHYLQLMNDTQTHTIPTDNEKLKKLSYFLGFKSINAFQKEVSDNRKNVTKIYNSIVGKDDLEGANELISKIKFENPSKAGKDLEYLREGKGLLGQKQFDKKSVNLFREIEKQLLLYLETSYDPDQVIQNFARVIRNAKFPSIWYKEFRDNKFFHSFLYLCEFSKRAIDLFSEDKNIREYYLSKKCFEKLGSEGCVYLDPKTFLFHILNLFTLHKVSYENISKLFKVFFVGKINQLCAEREFFSNSNNYFIASMGSFGSGDMTFSSDIDLIFVYKEDKISINYEKLFRDFLLILKKTFYPFDVDCRLRPEGKSSQLAWELESYSNYIKTRARTWEIQAFSKLNFVAGNKKHFNKLFRTIEERINSLNQDIIKKDILEMRKKLYPESFSDIIEKWDIKKDKGGIYDIDFIIEYFMISNRKLFKRNAGQRISRTLLNISDTRSEFSYGKDLIENYNFLKNLLLTNQNLFNSNSSILNFESRNFGKIAKFLNFSSELELKVNLKNTLKLNRIIFEKILEVNN